MSNEPLLYDNRLKAPVVLNYPGLTEQDIVDFCEAYDLSFDAMGSPKDWKDTRVFRAQPKSHREKSKIVPLVRVIEWKLAAAGMGSKETNDTPYIHYRTGERFIARKSAYDLKAKCKTVVFENEAGEWFTLPRREFFAVVVDKRTGKLASRFAVAETEVRLPPELELYNLAN